MKIWKLVPAAGLSAFWLLFSAHQLFEKSAEQNVTLLFMGDIMGHLPQIESAWDPVFCRYDYTPVFGPVRDIISKADFAIANLEVTLAGPPYRGYPRFSSPDALAAACKDAGIDLLLTANNHSCDRGKKGLLRTIAVLDSLGLQRTGTFTDYGDKTANNLIVLEKNGIRLGLLNYTYGTNGLRVPFPAMVNRIDTLAMAADIRAGRKKNLDKLIVCIHWGNEYRSFPSAEQRSLAEFMFREGVDIIIGGHPHVVQPVEVFPGRENTRDRLAAWSLGNFVSNQRRRRTDGGLMLRTTLAKDTSGTFIAEKGAVLTWVQKKQTDTYTEYFILPCRLYEKNDFTGLTTAEIREMREFTADTRKLLFEANPDFCEIDPEP